MNFSNETLTCYNRSSVEMGSNGTDFHDMELNVNITECLPEGEADGMPLSVLTVVITSGLGLIGIVLNIGILAITFQNKLIKKDYRMLYYMFITSGDLLFAINSLFVGINIAFQSVYVFKLFGVCLTVMLIFGVVAYEWSAICIILLLVDLVWTIRNPFKDNKNMKLFAKIGCIWTFCLGIIPAVAPFLYWNDSPHELPFCSIGNLYGSHLDVYQYEAVIVLTILIAIIILVSGFLLFQIYSSHAVGDSSSQPRNPAVDDEEAGKRHIRTAERKSSDTPCEGNDDMCYVISVDIKPEDCTPNSEPSSEENVTSDLGEVNSAFVGEIGDIVEDYRKAKADRLAAEYKDAAKGKKVVNSIASDSRRDARRREFSRACRTVGCFMAAYLGCCTPYLIWNALGLACGRECSINDRPETRVIRALVAAALYFLPVIDPILYTRRFVVIREAYVGMLRRCCNCKIKRNSTATNH